MSIFTWIVVFFCISGGVVGLVTMCREYVWSTQNTDFVQGLVVPRWRLKAFRCSWTNWTIGFWWGRIGGGGSPMNFGIDLGPCKWVWEHSIQV